MLLLTVLILLLQLFLHRVCNVQGPGNFSHFNSSLVGSGEVSNFF